MKTFLQFFFSCILIAMVTVTLMAMHDRSILDAGIVWSDLWARATLFDAYSGFLTFFVWVAYKERTLLAKLFWFVLIMLLGNIAMSTYVLIQLSKLRSGQSLKSILLREPV